ncbi:ABC-2 type transport system ATP-binding protein [Ruminococcus sp. YE71]|uniref:ABC transporter ATP-binding protein n=1 Tax=unclassified Ruminococcus TaxID=2608920 RepID=UPI0008925A01|nr:MULTISPECIES: ABC transporter ATP-binding protein [unclassified Ruminococcus]SDA17362.1 ABC-2 type transport system ATP-binding protein [Ruminococcus sp. YE78]SFW26709.1 ABC-2 type transport system ATP-binding protein [Ruminococcus sp. YE71]
MNAIEINGLTKVYKDFELKPFDLTLPSGCIMGLIGENGAGKSTTIKMLLGLKKCDSGTMTILGEKVDGSAQMLRDRIGVVLDNIGFPQELNAAQIDKIMQSTYTKWDSEKYFSYIDRFSLPRNKKFKNYSKGMKMRLGIAAALSHNAELLILDEPTSGLDPLVRDEIIDILNEYTLDEGHSVLISSHIVSDLEKICDYIAFLHKGRLMLCEEKDRLLEQYGFIQLTSEQLKDLEPSAILGTKEHKFAIEAIVDKNKIPQSFETQPVTIEELFIFMAKEEK